MMCLLLFVCHCLSHTSKHTLAFFEGDENERRGGAGPCVGPATSASTRTLAIFETHGEREVRAFGERKSDTFWKCSPSGHQFEVCLGRRQAWFRQSQKGLPPFQVDVDCFEVFSVGHPKVRVELYSQLAACWCNSRKICITLLFVSSQVSKAEKSPTLDFKPKPKP